MLNKIYFSIALFCLNRVSKTQYWQYETGILESKNNQWYDVKYKLVRRD